MAGCNKFEVLQAAARAWAKDHPREIGRASDDCDDPHCMVYFGHMLTNVFPCGDCPVIQAQKLQELADQQATQARTALLMRVAIVLQRQKQEQANARRNKRRR